VTAEAFDVVVLGGGIHGVGVLQAAAAAGYSACLLERRALASGTSSKSSKLIHGGLRYLETLQVSLVRESLREREILLRIAPELVELIPFHVPIYRHTSRRPLKVRAGLALYAGLARGGPGADWSAVPKHEWKALDGLALEELQAVFRYFDAQTDDAALVRAVARSAVELGGRIECPALFERARRTERGFAVQLEQAGSRREIAAKVLVNASGPWAAGVQQRIQGAPAPPQVELMQGAHIELEGALERGAYYCEAPSDRRAVFVLPWKGHTLVGTTETPFEGDPAHCVPLESEIEYLRSTFRRYFPGREPHLRAAWAGLRVLPKSEERAFSRPREAIFLADDAARPRSIGVFGGKLTGYRSTAEKILAMAAPALGPARIRALTSELALSGR
jgi:glycerol-3-phosphate dehydrogenase